MIGKILLKTFCVSMGILWALPCSGIELDPDRVTWSRLYFEFSQGGSDVTTEIRLDSVPASDLSASLAPIPDDAIMPAESSDVRLLTANISGTKRFLFIPLKGAWRTQVWFLPESASPLRRTRWKFEDEPYIKIYHYAKDSVYRHRAEPDDSDEADQQPENWTKIKNSTYALDSDQFGCSISSDSPLLLYILSAVAFSQHSEPLRLCLFNKKSLYLVEFRAAGLERLRVDYLAKRGNDESRMTDEIDSTRILITARAGNVEAQELEPFEVLKLRGDVEIFLDEASRLPVRIRGDTLEMGAIDLRLTKATLTKPKASQVP